MERMLALPVAIPLLAAAVCTLVRVPRWQRPVSFAAIAVSLGYAVALVVATSGGRVLSVSMGGWPRPFGIPFVADPLAALMLLVGFSMVALCTFFAAARGEDQRPLFHPLVLVLSAGVGGSFLTADLFNLFVFFEVMLIASYVLLVLGGTKEQVRGGAVYVTTNLLASTVLLAGVALVYGEAGTVNMADLAVRIRDPGTVAVAGGLLFAAFAVKSSLVPVHGWLPRSYPVAPPGVSALFSGLLTKVGIYAIYRLYAVVFAGEPQFRSFLLLVASVTMIAGVLGAVGRDSMREILAFHMVSQMGYILAGIGLFGPAGIAAGIFYMLQYIVVKTSLFLAAGAVETLRGTGELSRLSGLARAHPVLAAGFMVSALSLSGIPPLSGFFGKVLLVRAAFEGAEYAVAAVAVGVSFFTLMSMVKIWNGVFWGDPMPTTTPGSIAAPAPVAGGALGFPPRELPVPRAAAVVAPAVILAGVTVALGLAAEGLFGLADNAARTLIDPTSYITGVLGR